MQGVPEVLKHICSTLVDIVKNQLRQTGQQTKGNGRNFCILMSGITSVKLPALGATEKGAREIKLSKVFITLSNVVAWNLPITSVMLSFIATSVWNVFSNSFSL